MARTLSPLSRVVDDASALEDVVDEDEAPRPDDAHALLVVGVVARLVGVDERQVEPIGPERREGVGGRGDPQLDELGDSGRFPRATRDGGPLVAHVAAQHRAVGREGECHRRRAIAGERADLDDAPCPDRPNEERHERPLLWRDLHLVLRQGRRLIAEGCKGRVLAYSEPLDVADEVVGQGEGAIRHGAAMVPLSRRAARFRDAPHPPPSRRASGARSTPCRSLHPRGRPAGRAASQGPGAASCGSPCSVASP